jgi:hypothetical protein
MSKNELRIKMNRGFRYCDFFCREWSRLFRLKIIPSNNYLGLKNVLVQPGSNFKGCTKRYYFSVVFNRKYLHI